MQCAEDNMHDWDCSASEIATSTKFPIYNVMVLLCVAKKWTRILCLEVIIQSSILISFNTLSIPYLCQYIHKSVKQQYILSLLDKFE